MCVPLPWKHTRASNKKEAIGGRAKKTGTDDAGAGTGCDATRTSPVDGCVGEGWIGWVVSIFDCYISLDDGRAASLAVLRGARPIDPTSGDIRRERDDPRAWTKASNSVTGCTVPVSPTALLLNSATPALAAVGRAVPIHMDPTTRVRALRPKPGAKRRRGQPAKPVLRSLTHRRRTTPHPVRVSPPKALPARPDSSPKYQPLGRPAAACLRIGYVRRRTTYDLPAPAPAIHYVREYNTYTTTTMRWRQRFIDVSIGSDRIGFANVSCQQRYDTHTRTSDRHHRWETNLIVSPRRSRGLLALYPRLPPKRRGGPVSPVEPRNNACSRRRQPWVCSTNDNDDLLSSQGVSQESLSLSMNDVDMTH
jgi:hypothetical protein